MCIYKGYFLDIELSECFARLSLRQEFQGCMPLIPAALGRQKQTDISVN